MSALIVRFRATEDGQPRWGVLQSAAPGSAEDMIDVAEIKTSALTTGDLIAQLDAESVPSDGVMHRIEAGRLLSPVTQDAAIVCQGLNYADHAEESGHHARKQNLLFTKASSALCGPYDDIVRPSGCLCLDYEIEVGLVMRSPLAAGLQADRSDLGRMFAGAVLCNDVSARDVMFGTGFLQWFEGKSYRTFCPAGPVFYYLTPDEVPTVLENLEISLQFRGEERQRAKTSQMIFKPADTLTHIASVMDLKRGDMVLTGTPGGVLAAKAAWFGKPITTMVLDDEARRAGIREGAIENPDLFMKPGEVVSLQMNDLVTGASLGGQRSTIVEQ